MVLAKSHEDPRLCVKHSGASRGTRVDPRFKQLGKLI
jgi:hypothetical protein